MVTFVKNRNKRYAYEIMLHTPALGEDVFAFEKFRTSKASLHKSKEKVSSDGAEEKLLQKEDEAKITTRVDMADAKYVVGDHRNGDAKIELDANKRQFTGLTKEELMKYAEDPFWIRLRWFMFILFWALWLCMLAGAIAIIVKAPKCSPPPPRTWYEKGPLVDMSSVEDYNDIINDLETLENYQVTGIFAFACKDSYEVLEEQSSCLDQFKQLVEKTKNAGVKVIVDLTANFVSKTHQWFQQSENGTAPYSDYFIWAKGQEFDPEKSEPKPPNNWVSTLNTPMWSYSEKRKEFYLHHFEEEQPDLNFHNPEVVKQFDAVLRIWMQAGAAGVRLVKARELLVNSSLPDEAARVGSGSAPGADHTQHAYWRHRHTSDQPALDPLLAHWAHMVATAQPAEETVFTMAEDGSRAELFLLERNTSALRPPAAAPRAVRPAAAAAAALEPLLRRWPLLQLTDEGDEEGELAAFAMLLPAAPVLDIKQLPKHENDTSVSESLSHAVSLRADASVQRGRHELAALGAAPDLLACVRLAKGHTGYVSVYNAGAAEARADLAALRALPAALSVHRVSRRVHAYTNYTTNLSVDANDVLVPPKSSIIFSFVPKTEGKEE
ncbi:unnamed protein product, partial [Brenthis ino]